MHIPEPLIVFHT